jgi:hypothetical protein
MIRIQVTVNLTTTRVKTNTYQQPQLSFLSQLPREQGWHILEVSPAAASSP